MTCREWVEWLAWGMVPPGLEKDEAARELDALRSIGFVRSAPSIELTQEAWETLATWRTP